MGRLRRSAGAAIRRMQGFVLYRCVGRCLFARGVTIREATDADKLAIQRWLNPADANPEHGWSRSENVTDWVAHWRGRLAGFVQLVRHPPEHSPYIGYWLFSLYVKSPFKRGGIGEKLSRVVIDRACAEGAQTLDLQVFNDNFRAIQLYRKLGFEMQVIPELEPRLVSEATPAGRRRIVMRKQLGQPG